MSAVLVLSQRVQVQQVTLEQLFVQSSQFLPVEADVAVGSAFVSKIKLSYRGINEISCLNYLFSLNCTTVRGSGYSDNYAGKGDNGLSTVIISGGNGAIRVF